jgi:hypothetical protein
MGFKTLWQRLVTSLGLGKILCDSCKYDYGTACTRQERPNATVCSEYHSRKS